METKEITKIDLSELKNSIKNLAELQKFYKNQRKTVHKDCSRKEGDPADMDPKAAQWEHYKNRRLLRAMYAAYASLRGKEISDIDSLKFDTDWDEKQFHLTVDKIIKQYEVTNK